MILNKIKQEDIKILSNWEQNNFSNTEIYNVKQLENIFNNNTYQIIGAYDESKLCGYIIIHIGDKIDIEKIFVAPNSRKQGIGTKLVKYVVEHFPNKKIILEVSKENSIAISFYKTLGFNLLNTRKDYYGTNKDALILEN
jgi:ribosomal-protein-alanine N-acetyltransferase